jgi:hypothetical protein
MFPSLLTRLLANVQLVTPAGAAAREEAYQKARAKLAASANTLSDPGSDDAASAAAASAGSPCTNALAATFCASKPAIDWMYANVAAGCTCFYRCKVSG